MCMWFLLTLVFVFSFVPDTFEGFDSRVLEVSLVLLLRIVRQCFSSEFGGVLEDSWALF